jgi:hypothetical protein
MAFNLGILGQVLTPAVGGMQRGQAMGEAEAYRRRQAEEEELRRARLQAMQETLLQSREARDAEMHPLQMQTEHARALAALPDFAQAPDQLPGGSPDEMEQLKMDEIRSRIAENTAQAAAHRQGKQTGPSQAEQARVEREEAEGQAYLASAAKGGADDPIIGEFGRAFQALRQLHPDWTPGRIAYAARESLQDSRPDLFPNRQRYSQSSDAEPGSNDYGATATGERVPFSHRKFPSETLPIYLQRLKQQGIDSTTARSYIEAQGLNLE